MTCKRPAEVEGGSTVDLRLNDSVFSPNSVQLNRRMNKKGNVNCVDCVNGCMACESRYFLIEPATARFVQSVTSASTPCRTDAGTDGHFLQRLGNKD